MQTSNTIGILGCGWLGFKLGKELVKHNYIVHGTVRRDDEVPHLKSAGIQPHKIDIVDKHIYGDLKAFLDPIDTLIITLPPDLKNQESTIAYRLRMLITFANVYAVQRIFYTSSIGVFKDMAGIPVYDENDAPNNSGSRAQALIDAETVVLDLASQACILRLGGLIGGDRHPVNHLSGREQLPNPDAPVNLVHRSYIVSIVLGLLQQTDLPKIVHLVSEPHNSRKTYYTKAAKDRGLAPPQFLDSKESMGKKVISVL